MTPVRQWLVLFVGMAFLSASTFGAHLHLCFDGQEPPASIHVLDGQEDVHHVDSSQDHNDLDIGVTDQALAKLFKFSPSWFALASVWIAPTVSFLELRPPPMVQVHPSVLFTRFLLPPLRGPPV